MPRSCQPHDAVAAERSSVSVPLHPPEPRAGASVAVDDAPLEPPRAEQVGRLDDRPPAIIASTVERVRRTCSGCASTGPCRRRTPAIGSTRNTWAAPPSPWRNAPSAASKCHSAPYLSSHARASAVTAASSVTRTATPSTTTSVPACRVFAPVLMTTFGFAGEVAGLGLARVRCRSAAHPSWYTPISGVWWGPPCGRIVVSQYSSADASSCLDVGPRGRVPRPPRRSARRARWWVRWPWLVDDVCGAGTHRRVRDWRACLASSLVLGAGGTVGHAFHAGVLTALGRRARLGRPARRPRRRDVGRLDRGGDAARRDAAGRHGAPGEPAAAVARGGRGRPAGRARRRRGRAPSAVGRPARWPRRPGCAPRSGRRGPCRPGSLAAALLPEGTGPDRGHGRAVRQPLRRARGRRRRRGSWPCSSTPAGAWRSAGRVRRRRRRPKRSGRRARSRRSSSRPRSAASATSTAACTRRRTPTSSPASEPDLVLVSAPMSAVTRRRARSDRRRRCARSPGSRWPARSRRCAAAGIPVVAFQPTAADLELMAGDSLDPAEVRARRGAAPRRRRVGASRAATCASASPRSSAVSATSQRRRRPRRRAGRARRACRRRGGWPARR